MKATAIIRHTLQSESGSVLVAAIIFNLVLVTSGFAFLLYTNETKIDVNRDIEIAQAELMGRFLLSEAQYRFHGGGGGLNIGDHFKMDFKDLFENVCGITVIVQVKSSESCPVLYCTDSISIC